MSNGTHAAATIIGRMGKDVEVRTVNSKKMARLSLGVSSGYGDRKMSSWFDVVIWNEKTAEMLASYTTKGSRVLAHGELQVRKWQDKQGSDRYSTELVVGFNGYIELMDSKSESENLRAKSPPAEQKNEGRPSHWDDDIDDDVPF